MNTFYFQATKSLDSIHALPLVVISNESKCISSQFKDEKQSFFCNLMGDFNMLSKIRILIFAATIRDLTLHRLVNHNSFILFSDSFY